MCREAFNAFLGAEELSAGEAGTRLLLATHGGCLFDVFGATEAVLAQRKEGNLDGTRRDIGNCRVEARSPGAAAGKSMWKEHIFRRLSWK